MSLRYAGVSLAAVLFASFPAIEAAALSAPEGLWTCIVYGATSRPDGRMTLLLTPAASTHVTSLAVDSTAWRQVGDWVVRRRSLSFLDARLGREYTANLRYATLGGVWESLSEEGGWWCARRPEDPVGAALNVRGSAPEFLVRPLVPDSMASPRYPLRAIQEAREGEVVVCFLVDPSGMIRDPQVVASTDAIFETTTINAIERSRYRPTPDQPVDRPGCREFTYTLDMIDR